MNPDDQLRSCLAESLKSVHNHGAKLFNKGQHAEAFRLYQGALFVAMKLLGGDPSLARVIAEGLSEVESSPAGVQLKAYRLHEVIEQVRMATRSTPQST